MHTVTYRGHTLTWEEHSSGNHTFIVIPGFTNIRMMWLPVIEHLADLGRWVSLDMVGHYPAQTPPDFSYLNQETLLDIQTYAVQQIAGDAPVTLMGHSAGGFVALGVAARLPQQVQRVISLSSLVWGPPGGLSGALLWLLQHNLYPAFWLLGKPLQIAPWQLVLGASLYSNNPVAFLRNPLAWENFRAAHSWFRQNEIHTLAVVLRTFADCDIRPLLTGLPTPMLAITGLCDPHIHPQQTLWLAETLPSVDMQMIDCVGHILYIEAHDALIERIRTWVACHPV